GISWYEGRTNKGGNFTESPIFYGASGFLLQLHNDFSSSLALITAGHVFTDHEQRMSAPAMGAKNHSLFDAWGPHSFVDKRIPFNVFEPPACVTFEKQLGIDLAVVPLPGLVRRLLGQTTVPFTRANWVHQSALEFDFFAMLGLPNEEARPITGRNNG